MAYSSDFVIIIPDKTTTNVKLAPDGQVVDINVCCEHRGVATEGISVFIPPKSAQVNFL